MANSATILDLPEMHLDMVRPGIIIYGLWPSAEVKRAVELKPAMKLKGKVVYVKEVPAGRRVSYGRKFINTATTKIATLAIGYADGWSRLLSNRAEVLIHGRCTPLIGRVRMDQCMAEVTHIPDVQASDEAVLFGRQGDLFLPVEEVAAKMSTINYETVSLIQ